MKKIILFGDSITAGYKNGEIDTILNEKISELMKESIDIRNAGIPGDTSLDGLARMKEHVISHKPDLVTVFFGANDVSVYSGVSLADYESALMEMVESIGAEKVILLGPPYASSRQYEDERPMRRIELYNAAVKRVAKRLNCSFIDVLTEMNESYNPEELLQGDGLHFSEAGYDLLGSIIAQELTNVMEEK